MESKQESDYQSEQKTEVEPMVMPQSTIPEQKPSRLTTVTPLSKYLALALFIILPVVGAWIGYQYLTEKIVEVERVVAVKPQIFPPADWTKTSESQFSPSDEIDEFYAQLIKKNSGTIKVDFSSDVTGVGVDALIANDEKINRVENRAFVPHWHPDGPYKYYELEYGTNYRRPTQAQLQRDLDVFASSDFIDEIERGYGNGNYPRESHKRYHFLIRHNLDSFEAFETTLANVAPNWTVVPQRLLEYEPRSYPTDSHYLPADYSGDDWIEQDTGNGRAGRLNPSRFLEDNQVVIIYGLKDEIRALNDFYDTKNEDVTFVRFHKDNVSPDLDASIARIGFKDRLEFNPIDYLEKNLPTLRPRIDNPIQPGPLVSLSTDLAVLPGTEIETAKSLQNNPVVQDATFFRRADFPGGLGDTYYQDIEVAESEDGYSFIANRLMVGFAEEVSFDEMITFFIDNNLLVRGRITGLEFWSVETSGIESDELSEYANRLNEKYPSALVSLELLMGVGGERENEDISAFDGDNDKTEPVGDEQADNFVVKQIEFTNEEVIDVIYENTYKTPDGFYDLDLELRPEYPNSYDYLNHVTYHQVSPNTATRSGERSYYCSKSITETREKWSEFFDGKRGKIDIIESETPIYYDITTKDVASNGFSDTYRYRNFKCDYLSSLEYGNSSNWMVSDYTAKLEIRPITEDSFQELIEYLWIMRHYNMSGAKVLASFVEDEGDQLVHHMYATALMGGDWGICDEVTLLKQTATIDKETGEVVSKGEIIRSFEGKCPYGG